MDTFTALSGPTLLAQGHFQEALAEMQQEPVEVFELTGDVSHALDRSRSPMPP